MYVHVLIHSRQESTGMLIPVSAILRDDENLPFVYVSSPMAALPGGKLRWATLDGDQYEIPEGLRAGDQVVISGGLFVQFMQSQ